MGCGLDGAVSDRERISTFGPEPVSGKKGSVSCVREGRGEGREEPEDAPEVEGAAAELMPSEAFHRASDSSSASSCERGTRERVSSLNGRLHRLVGTSARRRRGGTDAGELLEGLLLADLVAGGLGRCEVAAREARRVSTSRGGGGRDDDEGTHSSGTELRSCAWPLQEQRGVSVSSSEVEGTGRTTLCV